MNLTVVNPIKLAEDIAMLDHFTGGRVFVGFSRGNTPRWTATFGQHIDVMSTKSDRSEADTRNRAVFYQNWEIVKRLWTQETVQLQDGVWKVPKSVPWEFYPTRDFRHRRRRGREPDPGGDRAAPATTAPPAEAKDLYAGFEALFNYAYNAPPYHVPMGRLWKGSPQELLDHVSSLAERFGVNEFFLVHHVGYFTQEQELAMLELFADSVIAKTERESGSR